MSEWNWKCPSTQPRMLLDLLVGSFVWREHEEEKQKKCEEIFQTFLIQQPPPWTTMNYFSEASLESSSQWVEKMVGRQVGPLCWWCPLWRIGYFYAFVSSQSIRDPTIPRLWVIAIVCFTFVFVGKGFSLDPLAFSPCWKLSVVLFLFPLFRLFVLIFNLFSFFVCWCCCCSFVFHTLRSEFEVYFRRRRRMFNVGWFCFLRIFVVVFCRDVEAFLLVFCYSLNWSNGFCLELRIYVSVTGVLDTRRTAVILKRTKRTSWRLNVYYE